MSRLLTGVTTRTISIPNRIKMNLLQTGSPDKPPLILIHGNVSSSLFWQETMLAFADHNYVIAPDLRGFGESESAPINATRGVRDFSDDLFGLFNELKFESAHLVGWSMGAGVVMQFAIDHPQYVLSMTLSAPISPYGFGGTAPDGSLLNPDAAGTGGGGANPEFVSALAKKDRSDSASGPRTVMRSFYVADPSSLDHEDLYVDSMLSTITGEDNYPGNSTTSIHWPMFGPGDKGVLNSMSPKYFNTSAITKIVNKPSILWIRGEKDAIVSDASFFDLNTLGAAGLVPGWPGVEIAPSQAMIAQTKAVLDDYRAKGGSVTEVVIPNCGHSPHLENPTIFRQALRKLIS
jgi:pimeloyl-ACP methyl ester carboxylesterase